MFLYSRASGGGSAAFWACCPAALDVPCCTPANTGGIAAHIPARVSIPRVSFILRLAPDLSKSASLINQVFLPHHFKLLQLLPPILRNPLRIPPRHQPIECLLVHQQFRDPPNLEVRRIQFL